LFNLRGARVFPTCDCEVARQRIPGRYPDCWPLKHPKAIFLVDLNPGERPVNATGCPFIVDELVKNGKRLRPTRSAYAKLASLICELYDISGTKRVQPSRHVFAKEFTHLYWPHFWRLISSSVWSSSRIGSS
jgi:hypothetical protein